jgi:hypothetical protein
MGLTTDEKSLIDVFRKLTPSGKDELMAFASSLASRNEEETPGNQCRLKSSEARPETDKTPIFTE